MRDVHCSSRRCSSRRLAPLAAAMALVAASAVAAGAQNVTGFNKPFSFGVMGGAAVPTGDLGRNTNTGFNITGILGLNTPDLPLNFRINVGYNSFGLKGGGSGDNIRIWEFTGNGTYTFPVTGMSIRPYLTGGLGMYNTGGSLGGVSAGSRNRFGFNAGGGLIIPLTGFNTFVEARYNQVSGENGVNFSFVPITFGVSF